MLGTLDNKLLTLQSLHALQYSRVEIERLQGKLRTPVVVEGGIETAEAGLVQMRYQQPSLPTTQPQTVEEYIRTRSQRITLAAAKTLVCTHSPHPRYYMYM